MCYYFSLIVNPFHLCLMFLLLSFEYVTVLFTIIYCLICKFESIFIFTRNVNIIMIINIILIVH